MRMEWPCPTHSVLDMAWREVDCPRAADDSRACSLILTAHTTRCSRRADLCVNTTKNLRPAQAAQASQLDQGAEVGHQLITYKAVHS